MVYTLRTSMGSRWALVIGDSDYINLPTLKSPQNDAQDLTNALKDLGFEVELLTDATRKQMIQAVFAFREALAADPLSEGFIIMRATRSKRRG